MLVAIPLIHGRERVIALVHRINGTLGEHTQVFVGYDRRDFDDQIGLGLETGHFQIDPDQIVGGFHGMSFDCEDEMVAERTNRAA